MALGERFKQVGKTLASLPDAASDRLAYGSDEAIRRAHDIQDTKASEYIEDRKKGTLKDRWPLHRPMSMEDIRPKKKPPVTSGPVDVTKMPAYKKGARYVPKTGPAKLHKGEAVLNVSDAKKYRKTHKVSGAARSLGAGKSKTKTLLRKAGEEMKKNPPKILAQTARKKGAAQAEKQRKAILLSKARAAGANIPEV